MFTRCGVGTQSKVRRDSDHIMDCGLGSRWAIDRSNLIFATVHVIQWPYVNIPAQSAGKRQHPAGPDICRGTNFGFLPQHFAFTVDNEALAHYGNNLSPFLTDGQLVLSDFHQRRRSSVGI